MVSLPSWRSMRPIQSNMCDGWGSVRDTPLNSAAGQVADTPVVMVDGMGVGLPLEMPNGPNFCKAVRLVLPGKQPASVARPAGVGVRLLEEKMLFWEIIS